MKAFAVFLDILGSGKYFTSLPDDFEFTVDQFGFGDHYSNMRGDFRKTLEFTLSGPSSFSSPDVPISLNGRGMDLCAIFSDCAYLVSPYPEIILHEVASAMYSFLSKRIPVRGGIGFGNFGFDRTASFTRTRNFLTEASFYGSSVVRAQAAEGCGLKGFRVFIHESAVAQLSLMHGVDKVFREATYHSEDDGRPPSLPGTVIRIPTPLNSEIQHELCYMGYERLEDFLDHVNRTEKKNPPSKDALAQYEDTRAAFKYFDSLRNKIISEKT